MYVGGAWASGMSTSGLADFGTPALRFLAAELSAAPEASVFAPRAVLTRRHPRRHCMFQRLISGKIGDAARRMYACTMGNRSPGPSATSFRVDKSIGKLRRLATKGSRAGSAREIENPRLSGGTRALRRRAGRRPHALCCCRPLDSL